MIKDIKLEKSGVFFVIEFYLKFRKTPITLHLDTEMGLIEVVAELLSLASRLMRVENEQ